MTIRGKWSVAVLVALVLSVALNLFVAGFAVSRFQQFRHERGPGIERMFGAFVTKFPREIRRGLHDELEAVQPEFTAAVKSMRQARTQMFEMMRADPLDKNALANAMTNVRNRASTVQQIGQGAVQRAIENADPEVRSRIMLHERRWRRHHPRD